MKEFILQPWPWWFSGTIIGLIVPLLYLLSGKGFGVSTSFQELGALCCKKKGPSYLKDFNWRSGLWTLVFSAGIIVGGWVAVHLLSDATIQFLPESFHSPEGLTRLLIGGWLIGFGTRYAGGCTSGHAINGIANLNLPSLIATIFFFVGGVAVTWGLGHLIF
jgi:uncharacterized membrane protein YedE/YeeE